MNEVGYIPSRTQLRKISQASYVLNWEHFWQLFKLVSALKAKDTLTTVTIQHSCIMYIYSNKNAKYIIDFTHLHSSTVTFPKFKQAHTKVSVKWSHLCVQFYWPRQGWGPWQQDGKPGILENQSSQQPYWWPAESTLSNGMAALLLAVLWFLRKWDSSYTHNKINKQNIDGSSTTIPRA